MVLTSNYKIYSLFFTDNGGESWKRVGGNLEETLSGGGNGPSMRTAEIAVLGSDTLYLVGGSTGLYATDKLEGVDTEWTLIGAQQFGGVVVENIQFRAQDGKLIVGTHGTGIFTTTIESIYDVFPDLVSTQELKTKPFQLFPNPATNFVNIDLNDKYEFMIVKDINGKTIEELEINSNTLKYNTSKLKSGIYLISLSGESIYSTKKLIVE